MRVRRTYVLVFKLAAGSTSRFTVGRTSANSYKDGYMITQADDTAAILSVANNADAAFTASFNSHDQIDPVLTLPPPSDWVFEATGATTPVTFSATAVDAVDGAMQVSCDAESGRQLSVGEELVVKCWATDESDNTAEGTMTLKVQDTTAPTVTVPEPISTDATSATLSHVAFSVTATDLFEVTSIDCSADNGASNVASNGGDFALGVTTVSPYHCYHSGPRLSGRHALSSLPSGVVSRCLARPPTRIARRAAHKLSPSPSATRVPRHGPTPRACKPT